MSCRRVRKELIEYADGELEAAGRQVIQEHLETCEECREAFDKLALSRKALSSLETPSLSDAASRRILRAMRQQAPDAAGSKPGFLRSRTAMGVAATAAMVVIAFAVVFGIYAGRRTAEDDATVSRNEVLEESAEKGDMSVPATFAPETISERLQDGEDAAPGTEGIGSRPSPVVLASARDYDQNSLRQMCDGLEVRKEYANDYSLVDAINLNESFMDMIVDEAADSGLDAPMVEAMMTYVSVGEPSLLPCYVEKARFTGEPVLILGLSGPPRGGESLRLSRMEVWVLSPERFSADPSTSIVHWTQVQ